MSELRSMIPPNSVEAEKSVLSSMLQENHAVQLAVEMLVKDDFYQPSHREIYDAMIALNLQQMPIDLMTVQAELSRRGTLDGIGGNIYLVELYGYAPATAAPTDSSTPLSRPTSTPSRRASRSTRTCPAGSAARRPSRTTRSCPKTPRPT